MLSYFSFSFSILVPNNISFEKNSLLPVMQNNDINSAIGDSGYMSCQDHIPLRSHDVHVQPHMFGAYLNPSIPQFLIYK